METKEIKITPPEGYEIDKENSTLDCIKFKKIVKKWRDDETARMNGFYITSCDSILSAVSCQNIPKNYNTFLTEKHGKAALAMARISQIMANDARFGGAITDEEWDDNQIVKHGICRENNKIAKHSLCNNYEFLAFHTRKQRDLFLEENKDLIKDYFMLD